MERRTLRKAASVSLASTKKLTYRAEICRRDGAGHKSSYYDSGDFSPYCVELLVDLLRGETCTAYQSLDLTLEIKGSCTTETMREIAKRFSVIHAPKVQVRICSAGNLPVLVTGGGGPDRAQVANPVSGGKGA